MKTNAFTLADAFAVQTEHLADLQQKLNPACFHALLKHVQADNAKLLAQKKPDPYDVYRGCQLYEFVANWRPVFPSHVAEAMYAIGEDTMRRQGATLGTCKSTSA